MIQRIQSIYLLVAAVIAGGLIFAFNLWESTENELFYALDGLQSESMMLKVIPVLFLGSALVSLFTIFQFKNRKFQFVLGRINILINLILLGLLIYVSQNLSGETIVSKKGIGLVFPIVVIFLLVMANRAIRKDEDLVKSVDRLR